MSKFRGAGKWQGKGPARSNTGASVRGKTISHPIPFQDDDEFPIRSPGGTGLAIPLGPEGTENPSRMRVSTATEADTLSHQTGVAVSDYTDPAMSTQPTSIPSQPSPEEHPRRIDQPSALRNSMTNRPSGSSIGKPQRKKSSLKSVFGRLFGRKSKGSRPSSVVKKQDSGDLRAGQHRSDPTALNRSPKNSPGSQKRSASLPINEFNRALRSHSIVADDFAALNAGNETDPDSPKTEGYRTRRATTPSRLWTPSKTPGYVDWTGLSPRPASSHARGSRVISQAEADAIGTAVTSGSHPNRRSRSLGELREAAEKRPLGRRRSDEIRYWRESYDPGLLSPISSNKPDVEEPILIDEPEPPRNVETPQPFNFGPLGEMAGMKITQAANLETRVRRLEERMLRIETMMASRPRDADSLQLQDPPKRNSARLSRYRSSSNTRPDGNNSELSLPSHQSRHRDHPRQKSQEPTSRNSQKRSSSYGSSRPSTVSTHNSYHPSFDTSFSPETFPPLENERVVPQNAVARPLSTSTTIRGIPSSSPTTAKDGYLTSEHYNHLTNMILAEQVARQSLQEMVIDLQHQLRSLYSSASHHPNPNSDLNLVGREDPSTNNPSEFSSFENYSSDEEGRYGRDDQEEIFRTPNEERGQFGDEIFGVGGLGVNEADKSAGPRTLSLSQITLGRGVTQAVNF